MAVNRAAILFYMFTLILAKILSTRLQKRISFIFMFDYKILVLSFRNYLKITNRISKHAMFLPLFCYQHLIHCQNAITKTKIDLS